MKAAAATRYSLRSPERQILGTELVGVIVAVGPVGNRLSDIIRSNH